MRGDHNQTDGPDVPINAVKRSYTIIEKLFEEQGSSVTELSDSLDIPKSSTHNHLKTLKKLGIVTQEEGKYRLSLNFFHMGRKERDSRHMYRYSIEEANIIQEEAEGHVHFMTEENGMGMMIYDSGWNESDYMEAKPLPPNIMPGCYHLHTNALGKAILSALSDSRISNIVDRYGLPTRTKETITNKDRLIGEIEQIRDQGYAFDNGEFVKNVRGVGVPISHGGTVYGAIGVYGLTTQIGQGDGLIQQIQQRAEAIRANIAYSQKNPGHRPV